MTANPLLRPLRPIQQVLPIRTKVVGIEYENRRFCAYRVRQGDNLTLVRDYQDHVETNAIAVYHSAGKIGFLTRNLAQRLAPDIDAGFVIRAKAVDVKKKDIPAVLAELSLD